MSKSKQFFGVVVLWLVAASASAGFFGAKITAIHPGAGNYFELEVDNPHFQGCPYFNMGKFETSDQNKMQRYYAAVLAAMAAQQDVIIWFDDATPCVISMIIVRKP